MNGARRPESSTSRLNYGNGRIRIALSSELEQQWVMLAKVCSAALNGIEAYPVEVEVNAGFGDTIIVVVGNN